MDGVDIGKETTDKYSLRGRVFHKIRENILSGKYSKGEELRENTLDKELGVSRTPVREALRQLELEGLVNIIPNKGATVTGLSSKDIRDIYIIRSYLEGLCAKLACENITSEEMEQLEEIQYLSEFHAKKKHYEQLVELDNRFHRIIYDASHSKILDHLLSDFHHYVERIRMVSLSSDERVAHCNEEHNAILEALKEQNADHAEQLAHQHIMNTMKNFEEKGLEKILD
ncbi:transcriptional regulator, GntR family [Lachnospiraceae bacterium KM106-2]|nr:transcriptional regulator, GntR family [Lachnospiraceae bacterium KM106-2]